MNDRANNLIEIPASDLEFLGEDSAREVELPTCLLSEEPSLHSFGEHQDALWGPAFDPVHLFLRGAIPQEQIGGEAECVAAIVKARHDLAFWAPMVELGLAGMFQGHLRDLCEDLALLEEHRPRRPVVSAHWRAARAALEAAMPGAGRMAA